MDQDGSGPTLELNGNCMMGLKYFDRAGQARRFQFNSCGYSYAGPAQPKARNHTAVGEYLFFTTAMGGDSSTLYVTSRNPRDARELTPWSGNRASISIAAASSSLVYLRSAAGTSDLFATTGDATAPTRLSHDQVWFSPPLTAMDGVVYAR